MSNTTNGLNIVLTKSGDTAVFHLIGKLDSSTAPNATETLLQRIPEFKTVILDFAQIIYISSAGLRTILMLQRKSNENGIRMCLTNVNDVCMEVLELTGSAGFLEFVTLKKG